MKQARSSLRLNPLPMASRLAIGLALTPLLIALPTWADDADQTAAPRSVTFEPRLGATETFTDNVGLSSTDRDAALVSVITPGLRLSSHSGRITGTLDYSLSGVAYTKSDRSASAQNALNGSGKIDLIDQTLYVDLTGNISQQNQSPFGPQSVDPTLGNNNRSEVANFGVSPYLQGRIPGVASVELRGNSNYINTRGSTASGLGDSHNNAVSLRLDGLNGGKTTWWAYVTSMLAHFDASDVSSRNSQAQLGLRVQPDIDLMATAFVGRERSDYLVGPEADASTYGASLEWTPTPRTKLNLDVQHHAYGNAHTLNFEHRLSRTAIRFSDTTAVNLGTPQQSGSLGTNYDLLYLMYASIEPDPVQRDALVRAILQAYGLDPNAQVAAGFITGGPTWQRNQMLSFSLEGVRTTLTGSFNQGWSRQLGVNGLGTVGTNFANVQQRGFSVTLAHKLTPLTSVNLSLFDQHSEGLGVSSGSSETELRTLLAAWTGRLSPTLSLSLSLRHAQSLGVTVYRENAAIAGLVQSF